MSKPENSQSGLPGENPRSLGDFGAPSPISGEGGESLAHARKIYAVLKETLLAGKAGHICALLDGGETAGEKRGLLRRAKRENPGRKVKILRAVPGSWEESMARLSGDVFHIEKVYAVNFEACAFLTSLLPEGAVLCEGFAAPALLPIPLAEAAYLLLRAFSARVAPTKKGGFWERLAPANLAYAPRLRGAAAGFGQPRGGSNSFLSRLWRAMREAPVIFSNGRAGGPREGEFFQLSESGAHARACELGLEILKTRRPSERFLAALAGNFFQLFDFESAALAARAGAAIYPDYGRGEFFFLAARYSLLADKPGEAVAMLCRLIGRGKIVSLDRHRMEARLKKLVAPLSWNALFARLALERAKPAPLDRVRCLFAQGESGAAMRELAALRSPAAFEFRARELIQNERLDEAERILSSHLTDEKKYCERRLELEIRKGDAKRIKERLDYARASGAPIRLGANLAFANFAMGDLAGAFRALARASRCGALQKYFPEKFAPSPPIGEAKVLILTEAFVGDEIRCSRLYPRLRGLFESFSVACDHRLLGLMRRSFPGTAFIPVKKLRELELCGDFGDFNRLPGADCSFCMDNSLAARLGEHGRLAPFPSLLPALGGAKSDWRGLPTLAPDPAKKARFRERLAKMAREKGKRHVAGLSWRSLVSDRKRDSINLPPWMLASLLDMEEILFVNCQYDPLTPEERRGLEARGNAVILDDVDQLDDIDSAAALYSALDLMITASTFSGDLSGALGVPTLIPVKSRASLAFCAGDYPRHAQSEFMEFFRYDDEGDLGRLKRRVREILKAPPASSPLAPQPSRG